jgi:hypothetical protein
MTGHGDIPMMVQAMKAGAVECLTTPVCDHDWLDAIQQASECDVWSAGSAWIGLGCHVDANTNGNCWKLKTTRLPVCRKAGPVPHVSAGKRKNDTTGTRSSTQTVTPSSHGNCRRKFTPKRLVGQLPHATDGLTQQRRRVPLRLHDPQAARVTDGGHQLWATHVGTHGGVQDRKLDTQEITKSGV